MHVHTNTGSQRLERVGQLLGDGCQAPDRALQAQLALHLRHLMPR
ncbi:MAG: helix-turn-helix domain-containing protein [Nostocoides sp.]